MKTVADITLYTWVTGKQPWNCNTHSKKWDCIHTAKNETFLATQISRLERPSYVASGRWGGGTGGGLVQQQSACSYILQSMLTKQVAIRKAVVKLTSWSVINPEENKNKSSQNCVFKLAEWNYSFKNEHSRRDRNHLWPEGFFFFLREGFKEAWQFTFQS